MKLSYDGHGLNDANDKYRRRLITWQREHADNGGGYVVKDEEARKLGPLLAAAPELLAACRMALSRMANVYANTYDSRMDNDPLVVALRAAIAKARGE